MNDRTAEKFYILQALLKADQKSIAVMAMRQDSEYGTEAYLWNLSFVHEGDAISVESFSWAEAVLELWDAAERLGLLNEEFIVG